MKDKSQTLIPLESVYEFFKTVPLIKHALVIVVERDDQQQERIVHCDLRELTEAAVIHDMLKNEFAHRGDE